MTEYIFTQTITYETVIKAATQEEAEAEFIRLDGSKADIVCDTGISLDILEAA